jgi:hypothetical protein
MISKKKLKEWSGGDLFYENKALSVYHGTFLSDAAVRKSISRILKGFAMLENSLEEKKKKKAPTVTATAIPSSSPTWLVGNEFSQADIAVHPRLTKAPQNGILSTSSQVCDCCCCYLLFDVCESTSTCSKTEIKLNTNYSIMMRYLLHVNYVYYIIKNHYFQKKNVNPHIYTYDSFSEKVFPKRVRIISKNFISKGDVSFQIKR